MVVPDQQPEDRIQSRVHSTGPRTPPSKHFEHPQLEFSKYRNPGIMSTDEKLKMVDDEVRLTLARGIMNSDKEKSYLYVFTSPEAKGYYKVGCTKSIEERMKFHKRCYSEPRLSEPFECRNAKLFEKVVLAEFLLSRRKHSCNRCKKRVTEHIEWIEAPLQDIIDSLDAWSKAAHPVAPIFGGRGQMEKMGCGRNQEMEGDSSNSYGSHFWAIRPGTNF
ncbi:hypothetical protein BDV09DRAFT_205794 [Aspergillus tetrazonus]